MKFLTLRKKSWLAKTGGLALAFTLVLTQVFSGPMIVGAASILNETFGSSNSNTVTGWTEENPAEIVGEDNTPVVADTTRTGVASDKFVKIGAELQGNHNSQSVKNGWVCRSINATGYNNVSLSYYWKGDSDAESTDKGVIEYRTNGNCSSQGGWTNIDTENMNTNTGGWSSLETKSLSGVSNTTFYLRFRNEATKANSNDDVSSEYFRVDGVSVEATLIPDMCPNITGLQENVPPGMYVNQQGNCVVTPATISATKVVCDAEQYLPNWGNNGADITSSSATSWVAQSAGKCRLQAGWSFQWANDGIAKPNNNALSAGAGWTTFGTTNGSGVTTTTVAPGTSVWVREQLSSGYATFSGDTTSPYDAASAEMYCANDVLNYDNYDKITAPQGGVTYHCVAFNSPADVCQNIPEAQLNPPQGYVIKHQQDQSQCVPEFVDVTVCKTDDAEVPNYLPGWTVTLDGATDYQGVTAANGCYTFDNIPYGNYTAGEVMQPNWSHVSTTNGGTVQAYNEQNETVIIKNHYTAPTGSIEITKYVCPANFVPNRNSNGVGTVVPEGCTTQAGVSFGYVHGTQTDANGPYPELDQPLTSGGTTNGNGVLTISGLSATGRYLIKETDPTNLLGLYCQGDGDQNPNNNDNQELTFVPAGGVAKCVAYNKTTTPPPTQTVTIHATKVVCENESDLPNWAKAEIPLITSTTATSFVASHGDCEIVPWTFEWAPDGTANPGDGVTVGGGSWTPFTGSVVIPAATRTWFREQANPNYVPFYGITSDPFPNPAPVSAEFYCNNNIYYYDNYEWIDNSVAGQEYYCIAFNAPVTVPLTCDPNTNLIKNGSFETPDVATGGYGIFPQGTTGLEWLVDWVTAQTTGTNGLEIQDNVAGAPAAGSGNQFAELDGDHPVKIWQDIPTIPGKEYKLTFKYSPRPGSESGTNKIEARAEGNLLGALLSGAGGGTTNWSSETRTFTATDSSTKIEFVDVDTDNSYGGYIDDVSLTCMVPQVPKQCEVVSDTGTKVGEANAAALSFIHEAWTAVIPGATWIWATDPVESPTNDADLTKVFTKTFSIDSVPTSALLHIAADNNYSVKVNNVAVPVPFDQDNFRSSTQDAYDITAMLVAGNNTLEFTVTNWEIGQSANPAENPAGLLYKLSINGASCGPIKEGELNIDPNAEAGEDQIILFPGTTTAFDGSLSTDPDGIIVTYLWEQLHPGLPMATIATPHSATTNISDLQSGVTYTFKLTVTDNDGATDTDLVDVIVRNPQCSDGIDNGDEEDALADALDPDCHSDGNPNDDDGTYNPNDNDETHQEEKKSTTTSTSGSPARARGQVLGAAMCSEYITDYIKMGANNDSANVMRLQTFLNEYFKLEPQLVVNGIYDQATFDAVKQFQLKEWSEVLDPWVGVTLKDKVATGWVYKTTKRWINMIKCPELNIPQFAKSELR